MQKLSDAEEIMMSLLWTASEDPDLNELMRRTDAEFGKPWKLQTIATFMKRLENKKYVSIYRIGRYSHYHAEVKIEDYKREKLNEMKLRLFRNDIDELKAFVQNME